MESLGYLCHLITDAIWFQQMADKYIRKYPREIRQEYYQKGYEDFRKLNNLLIESYNLSCVFLQEPEHMPEEVNKQRVGEIFKQFEADFHNLIDCGREDLELYPYDEIEAFIAETVRVCVQEFKALRDGGELLSPEIYYVKA